MGGGFVAPILTAPGGFDQQPLSTTTTGQPLVPSAAAAPLVIPPIQLAYWAEMDVEVERQHAIKVAREEALKRQLEQYEDCMDVDQDEDEYDAYGIKLPDRPKEAPTAMAVDDEEEAAAPKMSLQALFETHLAKIDPNGSPLGLIDPSGLYFRYFFPPGTSGTKLSDLLTDMSPLFSVLGHRFGHQAEERVGATMMLPVPVQVSPLAMVLLRDKGRSRYTDAISSMVTLIELYMGISELDSSTPGHKQVCIKYDTKLNALVGKQFYAQVDALVVQMNKPAEERQEKNARVYADGILRKFGLACDLFSLAKIHVIEWTIMDMLRVPYVLRPALMTPSGIPADAGSTLVGQSFAIMRLNLCRYTRNRNHILCGQYEDATESAEKRRTAVRIVGQAKDAFMPMNPDLPPIEDRLALLAAHDKNNKAMELIAASCLYGIYHGWIDLHTLREWLFFLSTDDRGGPAENNHIVRKYALTEDQELRAEAEARGDAVPMDENDD